MKKYIAIIFTLLLSLTVVACGNAAKDEESNSAVRDAAKDEEGNSAVRDVKIFHADSSPEEETEPEWGAEQEPGLADMEETEENEVETDEIYIKVGESILIAVLEENESAKALKELLADGQLTISASNYGGFEKVCSLGTKLPRNDSQTTTNAGDICLYNGNQIVIFYGSNSWMYTRLGKVSDVDRAELEEVLSGEETEITLSLEPFS